MPITASLPQPTPAGSLAGALAVQAGSSELILMPGRGVLEAESRTLMVADLHVGKAATFRAHGVPVPAGTTERTLARLDALIAETGARSLFLLGDLLHGPEARQPALVSALAGWRARHARIEIVLVRGNHDARAGDLPRECGIATVAPGHRLGGLRLMHEPPDDDEDGFALAGHLHPVCVLGGRADRLRLPCFRLRRRDMVLPAFGEFTGGWPVRAGPGERLFVTDGARVVEVPPRAAARQGRSTIDPVVCRDSRARCASEAEASG